MNGRKERSNDELAVEVVKFDLATPAGLGALAMRVRSSWTVNEIDGFKHCLHAGDFKSPAGWERNCQSGVVAASYAEDVALTRLWDRLLAEAWRLVGAASALHVDGAKPFKWVPSPKWADTKRRGIVTGDVVLLGDDDRLIHLTISELIQRIGNQQERQSRRQASKAEK